jgi:hypothetical protein
LAKWLNLLGHEENLKVHLKSYISIKFIDPVIYKTCHL